MLTIISASIHYSWGGPSYDDSDTTHNTWMLKNWFSQSRFLIARLKLPGLWYRKVQYSLLLFYHINKMKWLETLCLNSGAGWNITCIAQGWALLPVSYWCLHHHLQVNFIFHFPDSHVCIYLFLFFCLAHFSCTLLCCTVLVPGGGGAITSVPADLIL